MFGELWEFSGNIIEITNKNTILLKIKLSQQEMTKTGIINGYYNYLHSIVD